MVLVAQEFYSRLKTNLCIKSGGEMDKYTGDRRDERQQSEKMAECSKQRKSRLRKQRYFQEDRHVHSSHGQSKTSMSHMFWTNIPTQLRAQQIKYLYMALNHNNSWQTSWHQTLKDLFGFHIYFLPPAMPPWLQTCIRKSWLYWHLYVNEANAKAQQITFSLIWILWCSFHTIKWGNFIWED